MGTGIDGGVQQAEERLPIQPLVTMGLVVHALGVLASVAIFVWTVRSSEAPTGEALGEASAPAILGLVAMGAAALLARVRDERLFTVWLVVTVLMGALGVWSSVTRPTSNSPALQAEIDAKLRGSFRAAKPGEDALQLELAKRDALRWAQQRSIGKAAAFYGVAAELLDEELTRGTILREQLTKANFEQVPANATELATRSRLDATSAAVLGAIDTLDDAIKRSRTSVATARERLAARGADPGLSRGYLSGMEKGLPSNQAQLQSMRQGLGPHAQMLTHLQRTWGRWKYDAAGETFVFDDPAEQRSFDSALAQLKPATP